MMAGATGPYAASPMPTKQRVSRRVVNVAARPVAPEASDQMATPTATSVQREKRLANLPKSGERSM